jgi:hypothetical protein
LVSDKPIRVSNATKERVKIAAAALNMRQGEFVEAAVLHYCKFRKRDLDENIKRLLRR